MRDSKKPDDGSLLKGLEQEIADTAWTHTFASRAPAPSHSTFVRQRTQWWEPHADIPERWVGVKAIQNNEYCEISEVLP